MGLRVASGASCAAVSTASCDMRSGGVAGGRGDLLEALSPLVNPFAATDTGAACDEAAWQRRKNQQSKTGASEYTIAGTDVVAGAGLCLASKSACDGTSDTLFVAPPAATGSDAF